MYESCDFSEGIIEVAKIVFSLERVYGRIFLTEFGGTFFAGSFPGLFFLGQGENTPWKKPRRNSVNENSSKIRRNTSPQERWKNYAKRRQWQTYTKIGKVNMLANTQNSIIINRGKDLKISKNKFNRYGGQARSSTSEKNISTVLIVGKFAIEQLGCWTSLFQHFGSSSRM